VGNCYIFNPANDVLEVTLNNVGLGPVAPADPQSDYAPQSMVVTTARHDDGFGYLAIADPNVISISYPDDPNRMCGPYVVGICFHGGVSVADDLILYAGRASATGPATVVVMNTRGFILATQCSPGATLLKSGGDGAA
jgi:hypothetical protein